MATNVTNPLMLVIAATGQGKTTFVKSIIENKPHFVFDVNGEYDLPENATLWQSKFIGSPDDFLAAAANKTGGTWCVFEEATGFLQGKQTDEMRKFIVAKRHPQATGGRKIIMVFHSIRSVPPFLFDLADFIVLFRTGDDVSEVKRRRAKLLPVFQELQRSPKYSKRIIKNT